MGADYYATTVVGVRVDPKSFEFEKKVRSCKHKMNMEFEPKFCPECGVPFYKTYIEIVDPGIDQNKIGEYDIFYTTDRHEAVIGKGKRLMDLNTDGGLTAKVELPENMNEFKKKLKSTLDRLGLWKEEDFGVWTVGYCSY